MSTNVATKSRTRKKPTTAPINERLAAAQAEMDALFDAGYDVPPMGGCMAAYGKTFEEIKYGKKATKKRGG